jgi:hypothetical protein
MLRTRHLDVRVGRQALTLSCNECVPGRIDFNYMYGCRTLCDLTWGIA